MKLNELVRLRNDLRKSLDISIIQNEIESNCVRLQNLTENTNQDILDKISFLSDRHRQHYSLFEEDIAHLKETIDFVQSKIDGLSTKFFAENYQLELEYIDTESIRNVRQLAYEQEFVSKLVQRINLYSNWQYPALEIGCRDGEWTKLLVASDPLYIADFFPEFLVSAVAQFPDLYQSRVRKYLIQDYYKISNLPVNQFGLIFSYNFFNYLSLDSIKQFLTQSLTWLRPGGRIVFTYNNADLPAAASYAETYFMTYVPKSILIPLAESIGFETVFSFDLEPAFSLIEFKKQGELTTIKASQVLGEIKSKVS
jgi:SAM-dependent methyltransferase